jgi:hypothetical protein
MHSSALQPRRLALVPVLSLCLAFSVHAASTISDPPADYVQGSPCGGQICEPWQDILGAEITHVAGGLEMTMTLLAPIPAQPALPPGIKRIVWAWRLDTDPAAAPIGYPQPPGIDSPFEVFFALEWDGTSFSGLVTDRRPLLSGGQATQSPITVEILGNVIRTRVTGADVSLPPSFRWRAATNAFMGPAGSMGTYPVDNTAFAQLNPGD